LLVHDAEAAVAATATRRRVSMLWVIAAGKVKLEERSVEIISFDFYQRSVVSATCFRSTYVNVRVFVKVLRSRGHDSSPETAKVIKKT
jgi:hypothetical protein